MKQLWILGTVALTVLATGVSLFADAAQATLEKKQPQAAAPCSAPCSQEKKEVASLDDKEDEDLIVFEEDEEDEADIAPSSALPKK